MKSNFICHKSKLLRMAAVAALTGAAALFSLTAYAADGVSMHTEYPGVTVKAGNTVSFGLDFYNSGAGTNADLSIVSIPDGWVGTFEGDGNEISGVYIKSGESEDAASFDVQIPEDTKDGDYSVTLSASGSELTIKFRITAEEIGNSALTTRYAQQEGASGTKFSFSSTLQNNTTKAQSYSLSADAPDGWNCIFKADSTQVAAVDIDPKSSLSLSIELTPSADVKAGEYIIPVSAVSGSESVTEELKVVITGTYGVSLSTPSGLLSFDARSNKQSAVTLNITNSGNVALQNLNLSSEAPTGWSVEFSEATIDTLEAGATAEVTAYVTPSDDAIAGDYSTAISVKNSQVSDSAEFRVSVKTDTIWGIAGIALIVAALGCLYVVFKKFGRR